MIPLIAGLLASIICGIMGTFVVVNRIVFLSGGIAHAAYGGIGLAFYFGWPFLLGTIGFSLAAAFLMAAITLTAKHRADSIIGVIWALGMAFGIILMDLTPGYNVDLMSYLFGSILSVPRSDLWIMVGLGILITTLVALYYKNLLAMSYDEEFARIRGVPVKTLYFLLIGMLAVTIVLVIQVVGLILAIAPDHTAAHHGTIRQITVSDDDRLQHCRRPVYDYRIMAFLLLESYIRGIDHPGFRGGLFCFAAGQSDTADGKGPI